VNLDLRPKVRRSASPVASHLGRAFVSERAHSPAIEMDINALNAGGVPRSGLKSCLVQSRDDRDCNANTLVNVTNAGPARVAFRRN